MPAQPNKRAPLHEHDLELADHGGILLHDEAETSPEPEQGAAAQKDEQQTQHAAKQP